MTPGSTSPFDLNDDDAYRRWRDRRLEEHPANLQQLVVEIADPHRLTSAEHSAILDLCRRCNMAIYAGPTGEDPDKAIITDLGRQFGLERLDHNPGADEDAVSSLTVQTDAYHREYIPYTNRPITWHTDGYYNAPDDRISAMVLHTERPADDGGSNRFLDHTIAFIRLMDENPDYIAALCHPEAMTIPANEEEGSYRPPSVGPVFFADADSGEMQMRYTARTRSIEWRDDSLTREAVAFLQHTLETPDPMTICLRFGAGQGVLCNNVLHDRTGFDPQAAAHSRRSVYRVRFHNRVKG